MSVNIIEKHKVKKVTANEVLSESYSPVIFYHVGASESCKAAVFRICQEEVYVEGDWYWRALT
jgi:hypothetical protein